MTKILVTGANGQLGKCIADKAVGFPEAEFVFVSKEKLDITDSTALAQVFAENNFTHCINTAAYTNVEKAESEAEQAFAINAEGVKNLAELCKENDVILIHISTDYVFDGKKKSPYLETDKTNPMNVYGASKLKGEEYIQEIWEKHFILRTSWLYSQYGHNFYKSILRMAAEGKAMTITTEQTGTPTNANDLALALVQIIKGHSTAYGLYHFSNSGETTWYGFAKAILEYSGKLETVKLVKTNHYTTFAARPEYSVLDYTKASNSLNVKPIDWHISLKSFIVISQ